MSKNPLDVLRQWAVELHRNGLVSQVAIFGSFITKGGVNFNPATSDIDLLMVLSETSRNAIGRAKQLRKIKDAVSNVEPLLLRAFGRQDAATAIVSVVAATQSEIHWGIHKENSGFYRNSRFCSLITNEEYCPKNPDDISLDPDMQDPVSVLRAAQKFRNQYLKISPNGRQNVRPLGAGDAIPKELKRHAALLAWQESSKASRVKDNHYDLSVGHGYIIKALYDQREEREPASLSDLIHRRYRDPESNPLSGDHILLLWELLFDDARKLIKSKSAARRSVSLNPAEDEFIRAYEQDEEIALQLRVTRARATQKFKEIGFQPDKVLSEARAILRRDLHATSIRRQLVQLIDWALVGLSYVEGLAPEQVGFLKRRGLGWHISIVLPHSKYVIEGCKELLEANAYADRSNIDYDVENLVRVLELIVKFLQPEPDYLDPKNLGYLASGMSASHSDSCDIAIAVSGTDRNGSGVIFLLNEDGKTVSRLVARPGSQFKSVELRSGGMHDPVSVSAIQEGICYLWCATSATPARSFTAPTDWKGVRIWQRGRRRLDRGICVDGRGFGFFVDMHDAPRPAWTTVGPWELAALCFAEGGDLYRAYICGDSGQAPAVSIVRSREGDEIADVSSFSIPDEIAGGNAVDKLRLNTEAQLLWIGNRLVLVFSGGSARSSYIFVLLAKERQLCAVLRTDIAIEAVAAVAIGRRLVIGATVMRDLNVQFVVWSLSLDEGSSDPQMSKYKIQGRKTWELCGRDVGGKVRFWFTARHGSVSEIWTWLEGGSYPVRLGDLGVSEGDKLELGRIACLP